MFLQGFSKNDPEISKKGPLCSGRKTKVSTAGPHLIVEMVSGSERPHSENPEYGVQEAVVCSLDSLPRRITFKNETFYLRGVVAFRPPTRDSSIGHYTALCLRSDLSWEIYDDLRERASHINDKVDVNIHLIIFTV
ncbi:hypothetical protein LSTR_LSTR005965 [Laodelphax striatellus]|uniref:USP domain-containing protein n=1 Tax=Laodelphax striatellus TaxID=195883 RepID=A0A482WFU4_LAOST|nr:hypothetical protein LSTR_LSTR005965 [Laodelphax striatellus]